MPPHGIYGIFICVGLLGLLILLVMKMGSSDNGEYDSDRNFTYSRKGTYSTSGWMSQKEMESVLEVVPDVRRHHGTILGLLDKKIVCVPEETPRQGALLDYMPGLPTLLPGLPLFETTFDRALFTLAFFTTNPEDKKLQSR